MMFVPLDPIDQLLLASLITHIITFLITVISTNLFVARSLSITDGLNVMALFNYGKELKDGEHFGFHDSISSTVSVRGSTLNKLMVGTSYSIGLRCFLKLFHYGHPAAAIGYLSIICTGLFESRFYDDVTDEVDSIYSKIHHLSVFIYLSFLPLIMDAISYGFQ